MIVRRKKREGARGTIPRLSFPSISHSTGKKRKTRKRRGCGGDSEKEEKRGGKRNNTSLNFSSIS